MDRGITRRSFVASGMTAAMAKKVMGANDRIRLGIIGTGGRGRQLMRWINEEPYIEWVALCDAWDDRCAQGAELVDYPVKQYRDYRRLLDHTDIDGVIVATWDNNHAPLALAAVDAGKDVYVEKPMTNRPEEGPPLVKRVRETGRIVQVGTQRRSSEGLRQIKKEYFEGGKLGDVLLVRTVYNGEGGYLYHSPVNIEKKPENLDWEACLGPLPKIPWNAQMYINRFAYWDLSCGGMSGGLFVHLVDVAHWMLDLDRSLSSVALGGIYKHQDGRDTPDVVNIVLDYPKKLNITFEASVDGVPEIDIQFIGSLGTLSIHNPKGTTFTPTKINKDAAEMRVKTGGGGRSGPVVHLINWMDCMRSRKQPNADVVSGHYAAMACHMGNIAYKEKGRVTWRKEWDV